MQGINKELVSQFVAGMEILMETKLEQAYLYDFYGELLNEHQRRIYEDFVFNDLSLSEIASEEGISRQGVHDMIKRCKRAFSHYDNFNLIIPCCFL